ncbi:hypothetical protein [Mycobacterium persicum]|uniref:Uncharacterized protein n=1 Tax=Mycobacterium persicum TaxID=1487726 RepID=A0A1X0LFF5_9MYCO|nr:hypothetical protein [Mycobacterium persicum]KZS85088.1 hypothetical protein A4G31_25535 [Mycobacterium persicum]ORB51093.1 hypothetical protein BST40_10850 [Mycobacterium persicum]ORB92212.1 hypothetical protein B1T49_26490 [Mycobacterium persicum]ORB97600.1 hypothetical protein B1T44_27275 [Mycobacterium persicum]ORC04271.1 hypothetical protein B1T48_26555 [Mycobacterium persicum]
MTAVLAPALPAVVDFPPVFNSLSRLVIVAATVLHNWCIHRGSSFRRDSTDCRLVEQRETVS